MLKKYEIKIPNDISVFYCNKKRILLVSGPLAKKSLKLKLKILISKKKKILKVSSVPFFKVSKNQKKKLKSIQNSIHVMIKRVFLESSTILYKKLKLTGVGYRVSTENNFKEKLLHFKLGYSHPIYVKIPNELNFFCFKSTQLFVSGHSYQQITQLASIIRSQKKPEPYKGKGILYENEKIVLKEGKKV